MFRKSGKHKCLSFALICVGSMLSANACESENNANPQSSSFALECIKLTDPGIASYAFRYWDMNVDGCVSREEAGGLQRFL